MNNPDSVVLGHGNVFTLGDRSFRWEYPEGSQYAKKGAATPKKSPKTPLTPKKSANNSPATPKVKGSSKKTTPKGPRTLATPKSMHKSKSVDPLGKLVHSLFKEHLFSVPTVLQLTVVEL